MKYEAKIILILKQLGIYHMYKGCDYIVSSIRFIHENNSTFLPVSKILYSDIARQYNTSSQCVEKNIRKVIDIIWKMDKNQDILSEIFDTGYQTRKPGNKEFLLSIYNHIESHEYADKIYNMNKDKIKYICPMNDKPCRFYNDILYRAIQNIYL